MLYNRIVQGYFDARNRRFSKATIEAGGLIERSGGRLAASAGVAPAGGLLLHDGVWPDAE